MVGEIIRKALRGQEVNAIDPWKVRAQKFKMGLLEDIAVDTVYIWMPSQGHNSGAKAHFGDVTMDISGFVFADSEFGMSQLSIDGFRGPGLEIHPKGNGHLYRMHVGKTNYKQAVNDNQGVVLMDNLAHMDWGR